MKPAPESSDALIEVYRDEFVVMLLVYDEKKQEYVPHRQYPCAVGADEYRTPYGRFRVESRSTHPSWTAPDSDWVRKAGIRPGAKIPSGDPANPIKARWIGFHQGAGFHGTADLASLGHAASHGCVRMREKDVIELYPHAKPGTVVLVKGSQPN
jgi:lipoprotein-anchoring transpeptidase ErfK/SrfK